MRNERSADDHSARSGVIAVAVAFFLWGLLPLYLLPLNTVPALEVSAWRYVMGCITVVGWMSWRGELASVWHAMRNTVLLRRLMITACLLAANWTLYAWSVAHGQVLVSSLGYFINPLLNVVLGVVVLSERLNRWQWAAVSIATLAVLGLTIQTGQLPWVALGLAGTFGVYGLLRKTAAVAALPGLAVETLLVAPIACVYLWYAHHHSVAIEYSPLMLILLALSGVATVVPLTLFNSGVKRIDYATAGMLQYIGPTLQFAIGVLIYKEHLSAERLLCFVLIWLALAVYSVEGWWRSRRMNTVTQA